jgi:hypothetical protein
MREKVMQAATPRQAVPWPKDRSINAMKHSNQEVQAETPLKALSVSTP